MSPSGVHWRRSPLAAKFAFFVDPARFVKLVPARRRPVMQGLFSWLVAR